MKTGIIYKLTNKVNGKSYVGQTLHEKQRLNTHKRAGKNKKLTYRALVVDYAIAKYGFENFEYTVLERDIPQNKLNEREIYWINYFDTLNTGYNLTKGGQNSSQLSKKKVTMYDFEGNYIRTFDSIQDAAELTNNSKSKICNCCKYKRRAAGGYQWRYADDKSNVLPYKRTNTLTKAVEQYSLDGNYLATYKSMAEAARLLNKSVTGISGCVRERQKTAYGYIWKCVDKYKNKL